MKLGLYEKHKQNSSNLYQSLELGLQEKLKQSSSKLHQSHPMYESLEVNCTSFDMF